MRSMNARVRSRPTSRESSRVSSRSESPLLGEAKASPTPAVSTVWRSGRSSISQDSRKATSDDRRADQEHGRERVGEGAGVAVAHGRGQPLHARSGRSSRCRPAAGRAGSSLVSRCGEDGAERGGAERAAHRAEQRRARGRHAELRVVDGVLHGEHQHLHDQPEPEAHHEHRGEARRASRSARPGGRAAASRPRRSPCPTIGNTL